MSLAVLFAAAVGDVIRVVISTTRSGPGRTRTCASTGIGDSAAGSAMWAKQDRNANQLVDLS